MERERLRLLFQKLNRLCDNILRCFRLGDFVCDYKIKLQEI